MALADGDNVEGAVDRTADSGDGVDGTDAPATRTRAARDRWTGARATGARAAGALSHRASRRRRRNARRREATDAARAISGVARVDRRTKRLVKRLRPGDVAVIDHPDLDRVAAETLVDAAPAEAPLFRAGARKRAQRGRLPRSGGREMAFPAGLS